MSRSHSPNFAAAVQEIPVFDDWVEAVQGVERAVLEHPTAGADKGFDRANNDHLRAQLALNDAMGTKVATQAEVYRAVAESRSSTLDALAKSALLHAVGRHFVPHGRKDATGKMLSLSMDKILHPQLEPVEDPETLEQVLEVAAMTDETVREAKKLLSRRTRRPARVEILEEYCWAELRTLRRRGHREAFTGSTVTECRVDDVREALPITEPEIDDTGAVRFDVPSLLSGLVVVTHEQKSNRDLGGGGKTNLRIKADEGRGEVVDVPLIAAQLAQGDKVSSSYVPLEQGEYDEGHTLDVIINNIRLSINPMDYLPPTPKS